MDGFLGAEKNWVIRPASGKIWRDRKVGVVGLQFWGRQYGNMQRLV